MAAPLPSPAPAAPAPPAAVAPAAAPPGFYDWRAMFPHLAFVADAWRDVRDELAAVPPAAWREWPERTLYRAEAGHDWRVLPFCYTFPGDDPSRTTFIASALAACPRTAALLRRLGGELRTALCSRLAPHTFLASHSGWAELSNHVLRVHLPVDVPDDALNVSGVIVGEEIRFHRNGEPLVFDDSLVHSAFNQHQTRHRTVLILDLARPPGAAPGSATGGSTRELEEFIQSYFH